MKGIAAVLMASGYSTRFRPLNRRHKSLIEIGGKALLRRTLEGLSDIVDKLVIVYREGEREIVEEYVRDLDVSLVEHKRELIKGSRSVLKVAYPEISDFDKIVMLAPYHIGAPEILKDLLRLLEESEVGLVLAPKKGTEQYGNAIVEGDRIVRVLEKKRVSIGRKISAIYAFRSSFVDKVVEQGDALYDRLGEAVLEFLLDELARSKGIPFITASLPSLKYPRHALDRLEFLLPRLYKRYSYLERLEGPNIKGTVLVGEGVEIKHGAYIENAVILDGSIVYEYATIKNSFIGREVTIGNYAFVRDSSIGGRSIIGSYMEIARSVIEQDVHTHSGFIGDSVIDVGSRIGAGTITANRRLDRKSIVAMTPKGNIETRRDRLGAILGREVKVGIHVSFMPAAIVGSRSIIYPKAIVKGYYPEESVIR